MTREQNWSGNYIFNAARINHPASIDDARRLVSSAKKIRAIGTRHSFNGIADGSEIIDLGQWEPDFTIDRERMTVTVSANTLYGTLAAYLQAQGYALHNMGSLPHISVAGAASTGTHGSGDGNGILATGVSGLELIVESGDLVTVRRGDPDFDGMVVALGALGVICRITLDIQPTYQMRQDAFVELPWDRLLADFGALFSAAYSVSVLTRWTDPSVNRIWLKTKLSANGPEEVSLAHLGAKPAPPSQISSSLDDPTARLNPFGGLPGPWSERLPHFRVDRQPGVPEQIQSEYMVPRSEVVAALAAIRDFGKHIDPLLHSSEIRTTAPDDLWLSPSYGRETVALHFTWQMKPAEVDAVTRDIEDALLPLGGRPHWGKLLHADARRLAPLYPRMEAFRELATRFDPNGKFRNLYLERHVFG